MANIFLSFLLTSLVGTGFTLILALLKPITRKTFSSGWHYYMWLIVLIVMILPIRLNLPQTTNVTPSISETVVNTHYQVENTQIPVMPNIEQEIIQEQEVITPKTSAFQTAKEFISSKLDIISFIWFFGALLIFFVKILAYMIFLLKIHKNSEVISCPELKGYTNRKVITRVSDTICSPLIIGICRPTLLLPKTEITPEQLQNVLAHETTHLKRNDISYKWFVSIVKCLHWFNPAIYFISRQVSVDCEISCDLTVVRNMDAQEKKNYIETILALLTHKNAKAIPLTTGMTGNKKTLKKRFTMIKDKIKTNKKVTIISIVLAFVLLISAIVISGLTNESIFSSFYNTTMDINTDKVNGNNFNVLFVGLDNNDRADTIIVIKVQNDSIQGLSIPRNTLFKDKRISDILASENGDQLAVDTIKQTLSIPIHYYAKLDLIAIKEVVDALGGVDFDVPMNMVYDDPYQDLHINLKQGRHTLNGEGICQLLQFRRGYPEGDLRRIEIGQQFIKEFINQKLNKENIDKAPRIFKAISESIQTNYPISNFKQDIQIISAIKSDNITFDTIAGRITTYNYIPVYELADSNIKIDDNIEQQKSDIINNALKDGEEILTNSGDKWDVTEIQVRLVLDKISEKRQMKPILIGKGNYDIFIYSIWAKNSSFPRLFIINTDSQKLILSMDLDKNLYSDVINLLNGNIQKAIGDLPVNTSVNDMKVAITDIGCEDIADTDYIYEYFTYDNNGRDNQTISKKDGTISFYYKSDKKRNIDIKLVETETGNVDVEYSVAPQSDKIYTFNGLKSNTLYDIVLEREDNKRIDEPVYIVYQKYGENITPAPPEIQEEDIGFSQVVFENNTNIKDIENNLKKSGKTYTVSNYSYKDSLNSTKSNIVCDENGNISLFFDINAENLVDITFKDSVTKKDVAKFGILANDVNSYSFTGFDKNKKYDVNVQGKTKNNWKIEGQYIIF